MNRKSRILLTIFAVLMAAVLAVSLWPRGRSAADLRVQGWSPGSKSDKADEECPFDRIEVDFGGTSAVLSRGADRTWTMAPPAGARPDRYKVRQLADLLREDLVSVVPASPRAEDLKAFGLDDASRVRVTYVRPGAAPTVLDIGTVQKPEGGTGEGDTFVRVAGDARVWRILGRDLRRPFEGGVKGLRDRKLFTFDAGDVTAIEIHDPAAPDAVDRQIRLVSEAVPAEAPKEGQPEKKPERSWRFETPAGLATGDVRSFLAAVVGIYAQEYADALPEGVSISEDAFALTLALADGASVRLRLSPVKGDAAYLKVDGAEGFAKVAKYASDQLRKHTGDLRDRRLVAASRDAIQAVDLVDGGRRLAFQRDGNGFKALVPAGLPLGRSLVDSFLADLEGLKADAFLPSSQREGVDTGLDQPIVTVGVTTRDGGRRVLKVGADKGSGTRYVAIEGSDDVATLPAWALTRLRKGPDDLRNKTFFDFDPARLTRIEIAHPDETVALERASGTASPDRLWKAVKPSEATDLKTETVGTLVGTVAGFAAKSLATDPAARKAVAGKPDFTLTAVLADGSRHELKVFADKKDGDPYATASGEPGFRDAVLVLNAWQVKNVQKRLAELRK